MPALKLIRNEFPQAILSVDTFYADVAKQSVEEFGANIINDISGGQIDEQMFPVIGQLQVPYVRCICGGCHRLCSSIPITMI